MPRTVRNTGDAGDARFVEKAGMPVTRGGEMSVRLGLMALLAEGEKYGAQLRSEFEARTGGTWPLNVGQVYTTLDRLVRDGIVEVAGEPDAETAAFALDGGSGVLWRGEPVPTLDVRALYARAEAAIWADRAVSSRPSAPPVRPSARPSSPAPSRSNGNPGDRS